ERNTPEWYAFGLLDILALQGSDSALYQKLVKEKGYSSNVFGGLNMLGNMFNYNGPMLWIGALIHDPSAESDAIVADVETTLATYRDAPVSAADLERARTKVRSTLYDLAGSSTRFGLVDLLAVFALFDDNPARINEIEAGFEAVTPELIQQTAQAYLVPENRTVLTVQPAPKGE
ncbi:MAG: insulinase family protein, partial [Sphingomonadales bacterium]